MKHIRQETAKYFREQHLYAPHPSTRVLDPPPRRKKEEEKKSDRRAGIAERAQAAGAYHAQGFRFYVTAKTGASLRPSDAADAAAAASCASASSRRLKLRLVAL